MLENLVAGASEGDVVFEHHVAVFVKAMVLSYDCRASLGSMLLCVQIDLSEQIDGVGHGVLAVRIEHSALRLKRELEIEHALEVTVIAKRCFTSSQSIDSVNLPWTRSALGCMHASPFASK